MLCVVLKGHLKRRKLNSVMFRNNIFNIVLGSEKLKNLRIELGFMMGMYVFIQNK